MNLDTRPELDTFSLSELHKQNCATFLLFPVAWLFLVTVADLWSRSPLFVVANTAFLTFIIGLRGAAWLGWRNAPPQDQFHWAVRTLSAAMLMNGVHLSLMTCWALLEPNLAVLRPPLVVAMFMGTTLALVGMPPGSRARRFLSIALAGPTLLALVATGELQWVLAAGLGLSGLARAKVASQRQQRKFQEAVKTTALLRERTLELEHLSSTDPITQLRNRSHFDIHFELEWRRAHRQHYPLALLILDLDHFKAINDEHGHLFGDQVLTAVAATLQATHHRSGDLLARLGGEEFGLLLINTDLESAVQMAQKICDAVAAISLDHNGKPVGVTASLGVAAAIPDSPFGPAAQAFMHAADLALYQAKGTGRNRVCVASAEDLASPAFDH